VITYDYVLNWIAYIIQHLGIKTRTALILKGLQRIGKNRFTDVVCEMLSGYSESNVTDMSEMTGNFSSVVENKMLIVLNEVRNAGDNRIANWDSMKSIITDTIIRINEKNEPRRTSENVANIIFVTNNPHPVNIEQSDNRYAVFTCSALHRCDHEYFVRLWSGFTKEFYEALTWFFLNRSITGYSPEFIPMNDARREMTEASRTLIDVFCCNHYDELISGLKWIDCLSKKRYEFKCFKYGDDRFKYELQERCDRVKNLWKLKLEYRSVYTQIPTDVYVLDDDDEQITPE
jgi:hypothetical protein